MERVTFDAEESLSDHVPDGSVVESVHYNGGSETVEYVNPEDVTGDELSDMSRAELYSFGKEIGVELVWSGPEAHGKQEMIDEITEAEVGE